MEIKGKRGNDVMAMTKTKIRNGEYHYCFDNGAYYIILRLERSNKKWALIRRDKIIMRATTLHELEELITIYNSK